MTTVHLLRHARPLPPVVATSEVALSEAGLREARSIVPTLRSLDIRRIVCSPYRRAIETVHPFATAADIRIETDVRLREREMPTAGSPEEHIERVHASFADADYAPEDGESFRDTSARARACLRQLTGETPSGLLLVGHGQCLTLLLRSMNQGADFDFWKTLPTPAIVELALNESGNDGTFRLIDIPVRS